MKISCPLQVLAATIPPKTTTYVASNLAMCCHFRLVFKMGEATSKKISKLEAHMVRSSSAHGAPMARAKNVQLS